MAWLNIINVILPIFIIALLGFIIGNFRKINLKTIADLIIYLSSPALAFTLLYQQQIDLKEISLIALAALFVILGSGLICLAIFKVSRIKAPNALYLPIMFMNTGFIGYPLALFAFGESGLGKAVIYDIVNAILIFTLGIYIASQGKDRWQVFKIPFIYAALMGLIFSLTNIKLPQAVFYPLELVGKTTIPLALFMLGCRLAKIKISSWRLPLLATLLRLGLGFLLGLLAVSLFKLQGLVAKIVILSSALSSAITTIALAEEYNSDPDLVASSIALSTLISIVTVIMILNWLITVP